MRGPVLLGLLSAVSSAAGRLYQPASPVLHASLVPPRVASLVMSGAAIDRTPLDATEELAQRMQVSIAQALDAE
eukprot:scaffold258469_cov40-Tisochrysis_lutea.AAC.3